MLEGWSVGGAYYDYFIRLVRLLVVGVEEEKEPCLRDGSVSSELIA